MIIIQAHKWKYRLLNNGIMESSPADKEEWGQQWSRDAMNRTTGDISYIQATLEDLASRLPEDYILPRSEKKEAVVQDSQGVQ
jgi:hypothetical protein